MAFISFDSKPLLLHSCSKERTSSGPLDNHSSSQKEGTIPMRSTFLGAAWITRDFCRRWDCFGLGQKLDHTGGWTFFHPHFPTGCGTFLSDFWKLTGSSLSTVPSSPSRTFLIGGFLASLPALLTTSFRQWSSPFLWKRERGGESTHRRASMEVGRLLFRPKHE